MTQLRVPAADEGEWLLLRRQRTHQLCPPDWVMVEQELWQNADGLWLCGRFGSGPECMDSAGCRPQRAIRVAASSELLPLLVRATLTLQLAGDERTVSNDVDGDRLWLYHDGGCRLIDLLDPSVALMPLLAALEAALPPLAEWPVVADGGQYFASQSAAGAQSG
ncbi:MAG: hypothetical protein II007_03915 [Gammaproteobacteria bacterium]|nr:hypothetical protein [Gammaproteobacteria bacterium]